MASTSKRWVRTQSPRRPDWHALTIYTEGDVDGIMERAEGSGEEAQRAREKWYDIDTRARRLAAC
jgi:hypothetical protein